MAVEPGQHVGAFTGIVGPARRDHANAPTAERLYRSRGMKDRLGRLRFESRPGPQLEPELAMLLEAVARLKDVASARSAIDCGDPLIGPVVEAAIDTDRPVDTLHHAHAVRVRTARSREKSKLKELNRQADVPPDSRFASTVQAAALEFADEREQELVAAAVRRRPEVMEDSDVCNESRMSASGRSSRSVDVAGVAKAAKIPS